MLKLSNLRSYHPEKTSGAMYGVVPATCITCRTELFRTQPVAPLHRSGTCPSQLPPPFSAHIELLSLVIGTSFAVSWILETKSARPKSMIFIGDQREQFWNKMF